MKIPERLRRPGGMMHQASGGTDLHVFFVSSGIQNMTTSTELRPEMSGPAPGIQNMTVCKAISNVVDLYRLVKMYSKIYSFVFPKPRSKTKVTKLEVSFSAKELKFEV